ncbi:MAG: ABC transporter substrate-binding protein [Betaproteobacteria bacterium]|nr:ABC transporter substrate-binding protein [Betaproteobacteria bacterium]
MRRRHIVVALFGGLLPALSFAVRAQSAKVYRIAFLSGTSRDPSYEGFRQTLPSLGFVEGKNVAIDWRFADGYPDRLPDLVAELIAQKPDVIITVTQIAALTAKKATSTIPIVFTIVSDAVGQGLVTSLARPGGNVTGVATVQAALVGKRLEVFTQVVPAAKSIVLLDGPADVVTTVYVNEAQSAARRLGLKMRSIKIEDPAAIEGVFAKLDPHRDQAVILSPSSFLFAQRQRIVQAAMKQRTPLIGWQGDWANTGALMSYGANHFESGRRAAVYVAKILKGAKPADLPVEEANEFELVINLKTAKAIGLTVPGAVLPRADRVIN